MGVRRAGGLAAAALVATTLASCGRGAFPATQPAPHLRTQRDAWSEVSVAARREVGRVLVDADGYTLYLFVPDHRGRPTCRAECLVEWPPLTVPAGQPPPTAGPGTRPALLGTVALAGGSRQVTYNGWPLYLWIGDTAPGDVNGEAVTNFGGPWYAVNAAGGAVKVRTAP